MFAYNVIEGACTETFPIQIDGQKDPNNPCYQMTQDMELKFTFHPASEEKCSSFTYPASDFIWKYELQLTTGRYILSIISINKKMLYEGAMQVFIQGTYKNNYCLFLLLLYIKVPTEIFISSV